MADLVAKTDPDGVDFGWVMQVTFVVTIIVGAPLVAVLSTTVGLPTWGQRVSFAIRVGAPIWFLTALAAFMYAKYARVTDGNIGDSAADDDITVNDDTADDDIAVDAGPVDDHVADADAADDDAVEDKTADD